VEVDVDAPDSVKYESEETEISCCIEDKSEEVDVEVADSIEEESEEVEIKA
jgi:hypothetical protein